MLCFLRIFDRVSNLSILTLFVNNYVSLYYRSHLFQHDDACKEYVASLCTQNLMQCALGLPGSVSGLERPTLFVTRQLTDLILTNGFKKVIFSYIMKLLCHVFGLHGHDG